MIDSEILFKHYFYVSGTSAVMRSHLSCYAQEVLGCYPLENGSLVLEFGSNDGTLLKVFKDLGYRTLGVDPAENLAADATASGIFTIPQFFNKETASYITSVHGKVKLICANHCCAHIDDFIGVLEGVKECLSPDGIWVFEVGYLLEVFRNSLFDTVYHEHVDYHTVRPLIGCLQTHGLKLMHVTTSSIQGGALRCYVGWSNTKVQILGGHEAITNLLEAEAEAGLHLRQTFMNWNVSISRSSAEVRSLLTGLRKAGCKIAGYGAPAKATTLMYHFNLTKCDLEYIIDDNPMKQGLFSPGLHIPIVGSEQLDSNKPDYLLILAWNFADSIMHCHANFLKQGGRFIIPLPYLRVVNSLV